LNNLQTRTEKRRIRRVAPLVIMIAQNYGFSSKIMNIYTKKKLFSRLGKRIAK